MAPGPSQLIASHFRSSFDQQNFTFDVRMTVQHGYNNIKNQLDATITVY